MSLNLIRRNQVTQKCGMGKSQIYDLMARGQFPRPVNLTGRSVAWIESEIDQWIAGRIAASRGGA